MIIAAPDPSQTHTWYQSTDTYMVSINRHIIQVVRRQVGPFYSVRKQAHSLTRHPSQHEIGQVVVIQIHWDPVDVTLDTAPRYKAAQSSGRNNTTKTNTGGAQNHKGQPNTSSRARPSRRSPFFPCVLSPDPEPLPSVHSDASMRPLLPAESQCADSPALHDRQNEEQSPQEDEAPVESRAQPPKSLRPAVKKQQQQRSPAPSTTSLIRVLPSCPSERKGKNTKDSQQRVASIPFRKQFRKHQVDRGY